MAKKYRRINKIMFCCLGVVVTIGLGLGLLAVLGQNVLLGIYSSEPEVLAYGARRLRIICSTYFICGMMTVWWGACGGWDIR